MRAADSAPMGGVVVTLLDPEGRPATRAVSMPDGRFVLRAPAGQYRMQVRQVGFRPIVGATFTLSRDTTVALALERIAVPLPRITVDDRRKCRTNPAEALPAGLLWEEARTALLAAKLAINDPHHRFETMLHSRLYDMRSPPELLESPFGYRDDEGVEPWTSPPTETLARQGYLDIDESGARYAAPDLDVLLSPYFTERHCFRIVDGPEAGAGRIALRFEPVAFGRRTEIEGVIAFDRATRELREIRFGYVNLPYRALGREAEGRVAFLRLAGGTWVIPEWRIEVPIPTRDVLDQLGVQVRSAVNVEGGRREPGTTPWTRTTGGALLTVRDVSDSAMLFERPTRAVKFAFYEQDSARGPRRPVSGVLVAFDGSLVEQVTDERGVASFGRLLEGAYAVRYNAWRLEAFGLPPRTLTIDVPADGPDTEREVRLPTERQLVDSLCRQDTVLSIVVGSVTRGGEPLKAMLRLGPAPTFESDEKSSVDTLETQAWSNGRFGICAVPRRTDLIMQVVLSESETFIRRIRVGNDELVHVMEIVLPERTDSVVPPPRGK